MPNAILKKIRLTTIQQALTKNPILMMITAAPVLQTKTKKHAKTFVQLLPSHIIVKPVQLAVQVENILDVVSNARKQHGYSIIRVTRTIQYRQDGMQSVGLHALSARDAVHGGTGIVRDRAKHMLCFVKRVDVKRDGREKAKEAAAPLEGKEVVILLVFS